MRKIWIACGWVLFVAGIVLVVATGLAWLGGVEPFKVISSIVMGCLFFVLGRKFITHGRSFPSYIPADSSEAAQEDRAAARRMILQAIWIGAFIIVGVAILVGVLIFLIARGK
jgi:hypothetical protein